MNTNRTHRPTREINSVIKAQAEARRNAPVYQPRVTREALAAAEARRNR